MIQYQRFVLKNGLRLLVHEDRSTPTVALSLIYDVGSRDESPERTGFAHLFEHLMFGGSANAKDFDKPIQQAGGDSNAFTNNDMTNFYASVPAQNLETLLWLESDRMLALNINKRTLNVQRKVVIEEFKETTLNEPYGDVWHHLSAMAYKTHPYRWPVIGLEPQHIADAELDEVKDFYTTHYQPNNAILSITGNIDTEGVVSLVEKWFGDIPSTPKTTRNLPQEAPKTSPERLVVEANVPLEALYIAFHAPSRTDADYYAVDLLTDILASGNSSRLYRRLLKEQRLFTEIDCYQTGNLDTGLIIVEGKPAEGVTIEQAENAILAELDLLKTELVAEKELKKLKNRVESQQAFADAGIMSKAMNLCFYELIGQTDLINNEFDFYKAIQPTDIQRVAKKYLMPEAANILVYKPKK